MAVPTVENITANIYGPPDVDGFAERLLPPDHVIDVAAYVPNAHKSPLRFRPAAGGSARVAIFKVTGSTNRAVVVVKFGALKPEKTIMLFPHPFVQNAEFYASLGWQNPFSQPLLRDFVPRYFLDPRNRWFAGQLNASKKNYSIVVPIPSAEGKRGEIGQFASNGAFYADVLKAITALSPNAVSTSGMFACSYSGGIEAMAMFIKANRNALPIEAIIDLDGLFLSTDVIVTKLEPTAGQRVLRFCQNPGAGGIAMPVTRWANDPHKEKIREVRPDSKYLHNWAIPHYMFYFALWSL